MSEIPAGTTVETNSTEGSQTNEEQKPGSSIIAGGEGDPTKVEAPKPDEDVFALEKLEVPEELNKDDETFKNFIDFAKEKGFKHSDVQRMVNDHVAALKAQEKAIHDGWQSQQQEWVEKIKADPEIGGANLDSVKQTISKVLDNPQFADPEFRKAMDWTGAGNHPAVFRTFYRMAKALSEGTSVAGSPPDQSKERPSPGAAVYGREGPRTGGPFRG